MDVDNTIVLEKSNTTVVGFINTFVLNYLAMKYGDRLKLAREHKGLSQEELAKVSSVGQGTISKIERGDQNSSGYDAVLSHTLDIDAMWLYSGKDEFAPEWLMPGKKNIKRSPEIFLKLSEENLLILEQLANKILQSQELISPNTQNKPLTPTTENVGGGGAETCGQPTPDEQWQAEDRRINKIVDRRVKAEFDNIKDNKNYPSMIARYKIK